MILFFRPYRRIDDLLRDIFRGARVQGSQEAAWILTNDDFLKWRADIDNVAKRCSEKQQQCAEVPMGLSSRPPLSRLQATEIPFGSRDWWASMIDEKLRNYDVAKKRHHTDMGSIPTNVADLPQSVEPDCPRSQEDDAVHKTRDSSSDEIDELESPGDGARDVEGILAGGESKTRPGRLAGQEPPIAVTCGVMPPGTGLHDFHAPPSKVHARNA